ncbi:MAG: O-antigen ligase family protein [Sediminibacterium sp.]
MACYVFFNKGVAYSYLVEALWLLGLILIFLSRRSYEFIWDLRAKLLAIFLLISIIYIPIGLRGYPFLEVIRDSFVFQYGWFAFIVFLFKDEQDAVWNKIISIYSWFPVFGLLNFFLQNFVENFDRFKPFGDISFVLYKYGDMGVHLLISSLVLLVFQQKRSVRFQAVMAILILFNLLILTAYSRSGMLAYVLGVLVYIVLSNEDYIRIRVKQYTKYLPLLFMIVIPIYASIKVQENFQGRKVGIEQVKQNVGSFVGVSKDANLEDNKLWRLVWWAKILDDSFTPAYFFQGKGIGMSLSDTDEVVVESEEVRSPHNFHLTVMARFGVPIFCLWLFWLYLLYKPMFKRQLDAKTLLMSTVILAFIVNASFDVFLEGPMGAFPFWTWVGLLFLTQAFPNKDAVTNNQNSTDAS